MTLGFMSIQVPLLVFSDLDGTLLDHDTYSWAAAEPALTRLAQIGAPVVLSSSKTAVEMAVLQADMGLDAYPAIVENGSGLIGLPGEVDAGVVRYEKLRAALDETPPALRRQFTGFGDMSVQDVMNATGLTQQAAKLARTRSFSEPGLWAGTEDEMAEFIEALACQDVTARFGGRFLTLSFGKTKADRMDAVIAQYRPTHTIALGDAPNDVEMLEKADFGVIIANPHRPALPALKGEAEGAIIRTTDPGPIGWNSAINALFQRLNLDTGRHMHG